MTQITGPDSGHDHGAVYRFFTSTPALVVLLWGVWASAFIAIKIALRHASPEGFAAMRVVASLVVLLPLMLTLRRPRARGASAPNIHRYGAAVGALNVTAFLALMNMGMVQAGAGVSAVLIYTQPLIVALGARVWFKESLSLRRIGGVLAGWAGVVALVAGELDLGAVEATSILYLLLAAACWAGGTLIFKSLPTTVSLWDIVWWQNVYGVAPLLVLALLRGGAYDWGAPLFITIAWVGMAAGVGGFALQYALLRRGDAGVVGSWIFAVPVLTSVLGIVFLGEQAHLGLLLGLVGVGAGIYFVNTSGSRAARDETTLHPGPPPA